MAKWDSDNLSAPHSQRELGGLPSVEAGDLISREAAPNWTEAARHMLETWDAWIGGSAPTQRDAAHRLLIAGSFAAQAFDDLSASDITADAAPGGLLRAFLLALIDPALPDLDHLRACNRQPAALRALPSAQPTAEVASGLVKRLRGLEVSYEYAGLAADRIEALEAALAAMTENAKALAEAVTDALYDGLSGLAYDRASKALATHNKLMEGM